MASLVVPGVAFCGLRLRRVRLVATDVHWSGGRGEDVRGCGLDLLALLANRSQVQSVLSGPGVIRLD